MKHIRTFLLLTLLSFIGVSCTDSERCDMQRIIAEADSMNQNYVPMTNDSLLLVACRYFDRHGTPNERMKVHYLLGCVYRDMGEAPKALQCYYDAIESADTSCEAFDYKQTRAIYSQMAGLFHHQNLPYKEIEAWNQYARLAKLAKDTLRYIIAQEQFIRPYYILGELDSVLMITERVRQQYAQIGRKEESAAVNPTAIYINLTRGNAGKAKEWMCIFENESGLFNDNGDIALGRENYYYIKGLYYLQINQCDCLSVFE